MYNSKDITVLIATKDRVNEIERAIESTLNQSIKANIVILDDASRVNIKNKLKSKFDGKPIKWIRSEYPSGVAGARNKLVKILNSRFNIEKTKSIMAAVKEIRDKEK